MYMGHCYCEDCRKASGSGFIPFMGYASSKVRFSGEPERSNRKPPMATSSACNFCPVCGSLVFGGEIGETKSFTIYAGSLDDPTPFHPTVAIFVRGRPDWAAIPEGLEQFEGSAVNAAIAPPSRDKADTVNTDATVEIKTVFEVIEASRP